MARLVTAAARCSVAEASDPVVGGTVAASRPARATPSSAASWTTAGSTLHTASKRRGSPGPGGRSKPTTQAAASAAAHTTAHSRRNGASVASRICSGSAASSPVPLEVGEHHRRRRRPRQVPPSSLALAEEADLLEAPDEQRPRRLGAALVLDRPAQGEHRPSRDEVHRQLRPAAAQTGEDRRFDRVRRGPGGGRRPPPATCRPCGRRRPGGPGRPGRRCTGGAHWAGAPEPGSRAATPRPATCRTARRWPSTGRRSSATRESWT